MPLLGSGGGLEGVINVESPHPAHFDAEAQNTLEALATQATIALQEGKLLDTIEDVTEPYLIQIGFLARTARGRVATELAYRHMRIAPPASATEQTRLL